MNSDRQNASPARTDLDRLLHAAAKSKDETPAEMPFGFDTRVIALSRQTKNGNGAALAVLLRRITLLAAVLIVLGIGGAYFEFDRSGDDLFASGNEFAIADSAIQDEVAQ